MYLNVPVVLEKNKDGKYIEDVRKEIVFDVNTFPYSRFICVPECRKKKRTTYLNISSAFDIEDYTIVPPQDDKGKYLYNPEGFMYHWQWCVSVSHTEKYVCFGTLWDEFLLFIDRLKENLNLGIGRRLVVYCHYLAHEFQFMKDFLNIHSVFAKAKREPIKVVTYSGIEFRCSYALSNQSLRKFCESSKGCIHWKIVDTYDYKKKRTPHMKQDKEDLAYDFNDVYGLCECIDSLLEEDKIASIPLTSTGFVRRDCRNVVKENPDNLKLFKDIALDEYTYSMCKKAVRGGDTHASRYYADEIVRNVKSADEVSAYPWVMMVQPIFPISKYVFEKVKTRKELEEYNEKYATLFTVAFYKIEIKEGCPDVYIPISKCTKFSNIVNENGRVFSADFIEITIVGQDWDIIKDSYTFESFSISDFFYAERGYIYYELRRKIMEFFLHKTTLKEKDYYFYMKSKNKLNAIFGMMLTSIDHAEISYDSSSHEWLEEKKEDVQKMLDDFYSNPNSFLPYQWGIYVTAGARLALHDLKKNCWDTSLYWDTDSLKYIGTKTDYWLNKINQERIRIDEEAPIPAYVDYGGKRYYLGVFEDDGSYKSFKTLGAKKYAYEDNDGFHITVSGMDKKKGAERIGCIEKFKIDGKALEDVGRTVAYYNEQEIHEITVDGDTFLTASNIGIVDSTYTLGITNEYAGILEEVIKKDIDI